MQTLFLIIIIWTLGSDNNWTVHKEYALPVASGDMNECIVAGEALFTLNKVHPRIAVQASCQWTEEQDPV